jgi:hypothetical protein
MQHVQTIVEAIQRAYRIHMATVHAIPLENAGGRIRLLNGQFVENIIDIIIDHLGIPSITSRKQDSLEIRTPRGSVKQHSVDRHIYLGSKLVHVVECKTYLDSCYLERAYNDMRLFKKYIGSGVVTTVVALEDNCAESAKGFYADHFDHAIDNVFILMKGKRVSNRPIWQKAFSKDLDPDLLERCVSEFVRSVISACGSCGFCCYS